MKDLFNALPFFELSLAVLFLIALWVLLRRIWTRRTEYSAKLHRLWISGSEVVLRNYLLPIILIGLLLLPFWIWLIVLVIANLFEQVTATIPAIAADKRAHFYGIGLTITGLGALLAAPFVLIKAWINERQTNAAEQGLITERITKAVEQLGAEKTIYRNGNPETMANLEVRLGGIYALERIAQDSLRDHIQVMEILCAYIRTNAPASEAEDHGLGDWPDWPEEADDEMLKQREEGLRQREEQLYEWLDDLPPLRVDIQAALIVIGRRGPRQIQEEGSKADSTNPYDPGFRLDLRETNLRKADTHDLIFDHARFDRARMERADLSAAILKSADLSGWTCARTPLRSADFTGCSTMTEEQINSAFGVKSGPGKTLLPEHLSPPNFWHAAEEEKDDSEPWQAFWAAFDAWLKIQPAPKSDD
ncbi:MAG: pentapeptide repeat-containing protein [Pseudomonadota bacterium]